MFLKHLRTKLDEGKRGLMSIEHPSQVPDKYGLEPGEKMLPRTDPVQREPSSAAKADMPKPSKPSKAPEMPEKDAEEKAKTDFEGGVAAMNAKFREMDKQAEKGHSILGGRGWEGKVGKRQ